jgi:diguanylate cyclase (GGDEF)-like protein
MEDRFDAMIQALEGSSGEAALHDLAAVLAQSTDPGAIGTALTAAAQRVIGSDAVELVPDEERPALADRETAIALRCGGTTRGWLVLNAGVAPTAVAKRRLETLGAMAASALARLDDGPCGREAASPASVRRRDDFSAKAAEETDLGYYPSAPAVHDATFLNAVFPFALSQAMRHGESLSVLCVAIDRLGGIRELLGSDQVDRTVEHTARKIATLIRASDIVARLDDDRLMVLLPRTELDDGLTVARKLCQGVAENGSQLSDAPMLTLSIGVASYPACATGLYELLDASDAALSEAQSRGRNRTVPAPTLGFERAPRRAGTLV